MHMVDNDHFPTLQSRRRILKQAGAVAGLAALAGCGSGGQGGDGSGGGDGQGGTPGTDTGTAGGNWVHDVPQEPADEIVITNYSGLSGDPAVKEHFKAFEEATGVKATAREIPSPEIPQRSRTLLQSQSSSPTVYNLGYTEAFSLGREGYFEPVDDYIDDFDAWAPVAEKLSVWPPEAADWADFPHREGIYFTPQFGNGWFVFVNQDVFEEAGLDPGSVPSTHSEFMDACSALSDVVDSPVVFPMEAAFQFVGLIQHITMRSGATWHDGSNYTFTSDEFVTAADFFLNLFKEGYAPNAVMSMGEGPSSNQFYQGNAGMMFNTLPLLFLSQEDLPFDRPAHEVARIGHFPTPGGTTDTPISSFGFNGYCLSIFSPHKEAGAKYMATAASKEQQAAELLVEGNMPCRPDVFDMSEVQEQIPYVAKLEEYLNNSDAFIYPNTGQVDEIVFSTFTAAATNRWDGQRTAERIQQEAESL